MPPRRRVYPTRIAKEPLPMLLRAAWLYSIAIIRFSIPYPTLKHRLLSSNKLLPFSYRLNRSDKALSGFTSRSYTTKQLRRDAKCLVISYTPLKGLHRQSQPYTQSLHGRHRSVFEHAVIFSLCPILLAMEPTCSPRRSIPPDLYSSDKMMRRSVYFGRGLGRIGKDY